MLSRYVKLGAQSGHMGVSLLHLPSFLQCTLHNDWTGCVKGTMTGCMADPSIWQISLGLWGTSVHLALLHNNWVSYMSLFSDGILPPLAQWLDQQYDILPLCHTFPSSTTTCQLLHCTLQGRRPNELTHTHKCMGITNFALGHSCWCQELKILWRKMLFYFESDSFKFVVWFAVRIPLKMMNVDGTTYIRIYVYTYIRITLL